MKRIRRLAIAAAFAGLVGFVSPAAGDTSFATQATGEPIRIGMIMRPLYLDFAPAGAEAAIARINEAGGVNGRPIELVVCSNEDNANAAAACAAQFAEDPTIVATVGDNNSFGGDANPPLEQARIAGVGMSPLGAGDFASPRVFPSNSGGLEFLAGAAFLYDYVGARAIGMATTDTPTAQALPGLVNSNVLASRDAELTGTVAIPATAADVSSQAATFSDNDGIMLALSSDLAIRFMQAARQQGFDGAFFISQTIIEAGDIEEALPPDVTRDLYAVTYFDKTSDGYQEFLDDMERYQPDVTPGDLNAISWLSLNMFADVSSELPEVSRDTVWDALESLSGYDTGGMTPEPLDYTEPGVALGGSAPRLFDPVLSVFVDRYEDGAYVPLEESGQDPIAIFS